SGGDRAIHMQRGTVEPEAIAIEAEISNRLRARGVSEVDPRFVVGNMRIARPANRDVVYEIPDLIAVLRDESRAREVVRDVPPEIDVAAVIDERPSRSAVDDTAGDVRLWQRRAVVWSRTPSGLMNVQRVAPA